MPEPSPAVSAVTGGDEGPDDVPFTAGEAALLRQVFHRVVSDEEGRRYRDIEAFGVTVVHEDERRMLRIDPGLGLRLDVEWDGSLGEALCSMVAAARLRDLRRIRG